MTDAASTPSETEEERDGAVASGAAGTSSPSPPSPDLGPQPPLADVSDAIEPFSIGRTKPSADFPEIEMIVPLASPTAQQQLLAQHRQHQPQGQAKPLASANAEPRRRAPARRDVRAADDAALAGELDRGAAPGQPADALQRQRADGRVSARGAHAHQGALLWPLRRACGSTCLGIREVEHNTRGETRMRGYRYVAAVADAAFGCARFVAPWPSGGAASVPATYGQRARGIVRGGPAF